VPTDQEFAAMAREVLDVQKYPDLRQYPGGPPERPYDAAGWTLPLQMGVSVIPASVPLTSDARSKMKLLGPAASAHTAATPYRSTTVDAAPFDSVPGPGFDTNPAAAAVIPLAGKLTGTGPSLLLDPAQNNSFRALNRAWKAGADVQYANGRYIVTGLPDAQQQELVKTLALVAERTAASGQPVRRPRIGLFQPWTASMDEGWTRWLLQQYGFDFVPLRPSDFKSNLAARVDVVVVADDARIPLEGVSGRGGRGGGPPRAVRPEYADALNADDLRRFDQFIRGGGTLVCLNSASLFAIQQLKLPVRNVVAGMRPEEFFLRGSIVEVAVDSTQQVMAGMPSKAPVFADGSPVFETEEAFRGSVLARYQESGSPLLSGYLIGERLLNGKAAALDVRLEAGHVILFGFRPEWRDQSFGTFKVLFNAVLGAGLNGSPQAPAR
jgi:hypothetical protein